MTRKRYKSSASEELKLTGMVLSAAPFAESGKRVVLLTRERGKIAAFARGAKKPTSRLLAATDPFAFGTFKVYAGRDSYTLLDAEITNYFQELKEDFEGICYGFYFMEVADYYAKENLEASELLKLLYVSLRALSNPHLENELVRSVFEMKAMLLDGEYPHETAQDMSLQESTRYALSYVMQAPIQKLYTFTLAPEILREFQEVQERIMKKSIGREFRSMEMIRTLFTK